ncbi:MAG TPA: HU family DNA-binding protein [Acidimicrobiales bacterium]|nr:HU family DNA-binding protein [Acidimicrobiales bacterium]
MGKFSRSDRAARMGRNPQTGAQIHIAASTSVKFTAAKALKDRMNG